jgi:DNA-binding NarL/FixJ family response regulator
MFDMRTLPEKARDLPALDERERLVITLIGQGRSPREIAEQLNMAESQVFRLVTGVLDEMEPPGGPTLAAVHARHGSRPATAEELVEFDELYGASLPPDAEG